MLGRTALSNAGALTQMDARTAVCLTLIPLSYFVALVLLVLMPRPDTSPPFADVLAGVTCDWVELPWAESGGRAMIG
jgi:hypothetical protein